MNAPLVRATTAKSSRRSSPPQCLLFAHQSRALAFYFLVPTRVVSAFVAFLVSQNHPLCIYRTKKSSFHSFETTIVRRFHYARTFMMMNGRPNSSNARLILVPLVPDDDDRAVRCGASRSHAPTHPPSRHIIASHPSFNHPRGLRLVSHFISFHTRTPTRHPQSTIRKRGVSISRKRIYMNKQS